jgi:hypothetical protein
LIGWSVKCKCFLQDNRKWKCQRNILCLTCEGENSQTAKEQPCHPSATSQRFTEEHINAFLIGSLKKTLRPWKVSVSCRQLNWNGNYKTSVTENGDMRCLTYEEKCSQTAKETICWDTSLLDPKEPIISWRMTLYQNRNYSSTLQHVLNR